MLHLFSRQMGSMGSTPSCTANMKCRIKAEFKTWSSWEVEMWEWASSEKSNHNHSFQPEKLQRDKISKMANHAMLICRKQRDIFRDSFFLGERWLTEAKRYLYCSSILPEHSCMLSEWHTSIQRGFGRITGQWNAGIYQTWSAPLLKINICL